ncbi:hypothetical protein ACSFBM_32085 [Variovorax sp. GB1R11]
MDIVWMGALLALWAVVGAMVVGLNRLDAPKNPSKALNASDAVDGAAS